MNGYTKDPGVYERISNLIEQIPQENRLYVVGECIPWDGNPHELERQLTGYCLTKAWLEQSDLRPFDYADHDILRAAHAVGFTDAVIVSEPSTVGESVAVATGMSELTPDGVSSPEWFAAQKEEPF